MPGGAARFLVLQMASRTARDVLLGSGVQPGMRSAMGAVERMADRCAAFGSRSARHRLWLCPRPRMSCWVQDGTVVWEILNEHDRVTVVSSGDQAIQALAERQTAGMLLDLNLPGGNGLGVAERAELDASHGSG